MSNGPHPHKSLKSYPIGMRTGHSHHKIVCSCGVVISQCRCPAPKEEIVSPSPCTHVKQCKHVDYEHVRWGVETGVMIGGASPCHWDAEPGQDYCQTHKDITHV